jgi:protocatechuate 3,4-dioxygenase, alpha subunit
MELIPTPSQTVGPFFQLHLTAEKQCVACIAAPEAKGERVRLSCRVLDGDGLPVNDAMIEIWQADAEGRYNSPEDPNCKAADPACGGFGRLGTHEDGRCEFETIKPGRVPGPKNILQAPHLTVAVFGRGLLKQLHTRIYFAGDPANPEDPVLKLVPEERKQTLMAQPDPARPGHWRFDIHLQGNDETVFFDL